MLQGQRRGADMNASRLFQTGALVVLCVIGSANTPAQQPAPRPPAVVVPPGKPTIFLWPNGAPGSEARKDEAEGIKGETVVNVHNPSIIVFLPRKEINTGVGIDRRSRRRAFEPVDHARGLQPGAGARRQGHRGVRSEKPSAELGVQVRRRRARRHAARHPRRAQPRRRMGRRSEQDRRVRFLCRRRAGGARRASQRSRQSRRGRSGRAIELTSRFSGADLSGQEPPDSAGCGFSSRVHGRGLRRSSGHLVGLAEAYLRFKKAGVQAELHIYAKTGHGFGIRPERAGQSHQEWPVQLVSFLGRTASLSSSATGRSQPSPPARVPSRTYAR